MKRSWNLAKENFWHVLGVIIVAAIITGVIGAILRSIGGSSWFGSWLLSAIAQILTAPFSALVSVVLYLDLRARKEALTADSLRTELAQNA
jgi:phosphotransferase system  glucose/maltose/N-acetylglucosamine-specific IIC component